MNKIKPLNTEEIKDCFDKLGEIEGFEIQEIIYCGSDASLMLFHEYFYPLHSLGNWNLSPHFLTRVIEAINKQKRIQITIDEEQIELWEGFEKCHWFGMFKNYNSIDEAKTAVIRKYLEVVK